MDQPTNWWDQYLSIQPGVKVEITSEDDVVPVKPEMTATEGTTEATNGPPPLKRIKTEPTSTDIKPEPIEYGPPLKIPKTEPNTVASPAINTVLPDANPANHLQSPQFPPFFFLGGLPRYHQTDIQLHCFNAELEHRRRLEATAAQHRMMAARSYQGLLISAARKYPQTSFRRRSPLPEPSRPAVRIVEIGKTLDFGENKAKLTAAEQQQLQTTYDALHKEHNRRMLWLMAKEGGFDGDIQRYADAAGTSKKAAYTFLLYERNKGNRLTGFYVGTGCQKTRRFIRCAHPDQD